ncbi:hypothetical protein J4464_03430 [Candidatus Woesearchaeota archaeon]|nr:hypothetical protein [Candidatus Woesearchaeota archaeon]
MKLLKTKGILAAIIFLIAIAAVVVATADDNSWKGRKCNKLFCFGEPKLDSFVDLHIIQGGDNPNIWINMNTTFLGFPISNADCYGVLHLPSTDIFTYCADSRNLNFWYGNPDDPVPLTPELMPPAGTPIKVDVYIFFMGQSFHLREKLTNWE